MSSQCWAAASAALIAARAEGGSPWRADWLSFGLYDDGWTRPGVVARVRSFARPGQTEPLERSLVLQFEAPPTLIETLSHDLRITDGVVRFRVIKNLPGTPPAPDSAPPVVATAAPPAAGAESTAEA